MSEDENYIEHYAEPGIRSLHKPVPLWLYILYAVVPIWAAISLILYWNGSIGWLDRGYWAELQSVAQTRFPQVESTKPQFPD